VEPRARVELAACRLRNEQFSFIPFVFFPAHSLLVRAFRYLSPAQYATQYATDSPKGNWDDRLLYHGEEFLDARGCQQARRRHPNLATAHCRQNGKRTASQESGRGQYTTLDSPRYCQSKESPTGHKARKEKESLGRAGLGLLLGLLLPSLLCWPAQAQERTAYAVPFHAVRGMILLDGQLNCHPVTLLLDTGANNSVMDYRAAGFLA